MRRALAAAILLSLMVISCDREPSPRLDPAIARFIAAKRTQTQLMPAAQTNGLPDTIWKVFDAAERWNFARATNHFRKLQLEGKWYLQDPPRLGRFGALIDKSQEWIGLKPKLWPGLETGAWSPVHEVIGIMELHQAWDHKWLQRFGRDIIDSIPTNSIYFGGTDDGRFIVSALSESHVTGQPFFTLTQNALADGSYLDYLRFMYGGKIRLPTPNDAQQAFQDYLQDAQRRYEKEELKPGEDVKIQDNSRVQVSGQIAVMSINARIAYNIFTNNPDREFFLEESHHQSFPLDWMYPHLSPHGLILKINRVPLAELRPDIVKRDREYWKKQTGELVGDWITDETPLKEVCNFNEKVYLRKDLVGFPGDIGYARNESAQKAYAKLRSAIGGLYAWRAKYAETAAEKRRMNREAELAFKQGLALCPYSHEVSFRYVELLLGQQRKEEAMQVAETLHAFDLKNTITGGLLEQLRSLQITPSTSRPATNITVDAR